jgi:hypothetical protein
MSREKVGEIVDAYLEQGPNLLRGTARTLDEQAVRASPMETSLAGSGHGLGAEPSRGSGEALGPGW